MATTPWYTIPTNAQNIFGIPAIQNLSNPFAALPSGQQYATGAATNAQNYANQWGNLPNMGRDFYAAYAPSAVGSQAYSQKYNAMLNSMINPTMRAAKQFANTTSLATAPRGGTSYGPRGLPNRQSAMYQQAVDAVVNQAQQRQQQAYSNIRGEELQRANLAQSGAQLAAQQAQQIQAARLAAAQLQVQEAYQRAQQQMAMRELLLPYMAQATNQLAPWEENMKRQMASLQLKQAYQQQMDKEAAAQTLQRYYTGAGAGQYGNELTDYARERAKAQRDQLEQAMIAMGIATPVQRQQDVSKLLGQSNQQPQSMFFR